MLVAVVLGNRLNDDGSITNVMESRLKMAIEINSKFNPDIIIVSGGFANPKANATEADRMFDYLVANGIDGSKIVKENRSLTTKQNAEFSVPLANELGATELLLCTSIEHMARKYLNPIKLFQKHLVNYPHIKLSAYCE